MENLQLLIDLHQRAERQGPGSDAVTQKALDMTGIDPSAPLKIADIGCGTGASTLVLAQQLKNAQITAVDFLPEFLQVLQESAQKAGMAERISTLSVSMDELPFQSETYDLIWSEGAIYNIGFEKGIQDWYRYLKTGGLLVVSEITWTTDVRPQAIQDHWQAEYQEINTASAKLAQLEKNGYSPIGYFTLPEECWFDQYYQPMQAGFKEFLARHENSDAAQAIVAAEQYEIELYQQYKAYYSYGMYISKKR